MLQKWWTGSFCRYFQEAVLPVDPALARAVDRGAPEGAVLRLSNRTPAKAEAEGYVHSVPGKGSFAAPNTGVDAARREELLMAFDKTAAELLYLGLTAEELAARITALRGGEAQ